MSGRVGKPYADALFSLCVETDTLEPVHSALENCQRVFSDNPALYQLLSVPTIAAADKLALVKRLFSEQDYVFALLSMLTQRGRIKQFPEVCEAFEQQYHDAHNLAEMTVTTCVPLQDSQRQKLLETLSKKYGKQIVLTEQTDPAILGGMIVRYGDTVLDNSIKTQLERVRQKLRS